ncbi:Gfo/Idh/MocA family oxidoreductase [Clostridium sp. AL.422]|uniref:Gfo/Idh/MocA family protein n=1 Tax=Clostridium TaxID=1485 RepID=UPI00293DDCD1|nr:MULTISPECIES: Gfo/Idh/MocA family oxidoreductase [unclassified Clostridium]MDV4150349.1 Gfo/Idh/MocA family oxidoreductase [Clostridium sp. AL.422]
MKVAIIGLGAIAKKAYLPILSAMEDVELLISTRNKKVLEEVSNKYKIDRAYNQLDNLLKEDFDAAIISTHADGHYEIAKRLLEKGVNIYIDKPITYNLKESMEIEEIVKEKNLIAMVGFNRRFCPMVRKLKEKGKADIILMEKNREYPPGDIRRFIVEDFIHVVDTLRFLMDEEIKSMDINFLKEGNNLKNVVVTFKGYKTTAIGIMNRTAGITEENIEYMIQGNKYVIEDLSDFYKVNNKGKTKTTYGGWDNTLYKRGFEDLITHFLDSVKEGKAPNPSIEDSIITHKICEYIVNHINNN